MKTMILENIYNEFMEDDNWQIANEFNRISEKVTEELTSLLGKEKFIEIEDELNGAYGDYEKFGFKHGFQAAFSLFRETGLMQEYDPHSLEGWKKFVLETDIKAYITRTGKLPESREQLEKWNEAMSKAYKKSGAAHE